MIKNLSITCLFLNIIQFNRFFIKPYLIEQGYNK